MLIHRSLAAIVGILMLSHPMVATASIPSAIAQSQNNSPESEEGKQLLNEAEKLLQQGTGESKLSAIALYSQALLIWRKIGDRNNEATTLLSIGTIYYTLSQNQKALEYYNQALVIRLELKDRFGEAVMLSSVAGAYSNLGDKQTCITILQASAVIISS